MPPVPRKTVPRKAPPRKGPVSGNDDFQSWQDNQPVIAVEPDSETGGDYFPGDPEIPTPTPTPEQPPQVKKPLADRARGWLNRTRQPAKRSPGRPKVNKPRVSVESIVSTGWGILAQVVNNVNPPVARMLQMQAPVAGMVLEDRVKNTTLDRMLQPLAQAGEGGEAVFAIVAPPVLVAAMTSERIPAQTRVAMRPVLRQALRSWIKIAGPKMEELARQEIEFESKYGQQIDAMIEFILYGEEGPGVPASPNGQAVPGEFTVSG